MAVENVSSEKNRIKKKKRKDEENESQGRRARKGGLGNGENNEDEDVDNKMTGFIKPSCLRAAAPLIDSFGLFSVTNTSVSGAGAGQGLDRGLSLFVCVYTCVCVWIGMLNGDACLFYSEERIITCPCLILFRGNN